jgi:hypothetical protein
VGSGVGVGVGLGVVPGFGVGVGFAVGGSGGVGQLASAGLNGVAEADGITDADAEGDADAFAEADEEACADADALADADGNGVGVNDGVGVTKYGVYEGHATRLGVGGAWLPAMMSEIATAMAPITTVTTNVTAPHSRSSSLTQLTPPAPAAHRPTPDRREQGARSLPASLLVCRRRAVPR